MPKHQHTAGVCSLLVCPFAEAKRADSRMPLDANGIRVSLGDVVRSNAIPSFGRYATVEKIAPSGVLTLRLHLWDKVIRLESSLVTIVEG